MSSWRLWEEATNTKEKKKEMETLNVNDHISSAATSAVKGETCRGGVRMRGNDKPYGSRRGAERSRSTPSPPLPTHTTQHNTRGDKVHRVCVVCSEEQRTGGLRLHPHVEPLMSRHSDTIVHS